MIEFYTPEDLSQTLKLNRVTIYRLLRQGKLPGVKIGKSFRISESDFRDWLDTQRIIKKERPRMEGRPSLPAVVESFLDRLKKSPAPFHNKIVLVILFGSHARGTAGPDSDVDLIVVHENFSNREEEKIWHLLTKAELKTEGDISLLLKTRSEWDAMRRTGSAFYRTVTGEGQILWPERLATKAPTGPARSRH